MVSSMHTYRQAKVPQPHTHTHTARAIMLLPHPHTKRLKNRSALWCHSLSVWCQKPCKRHCEQWHGIWEDRGRSQVKQQLCILYYKHGWNTYLTCSADLWKHTSGCSANKSRLYCPLTSAELLIVNVTQLQRRASTVDWGSLSLTSWLTAANARLIYPITWNIHTSTQAQHAIVSSTVRCIGLPASGRSVYRRLVRSTSAVSAISFLMRGFSQKQNKYGCGVQGLKSMRPLKRK